MDRRFTIAVADDDASSRRVLKDALERLGHRVHAATDAAQLAAACRSHAIDLLIVGVHASQLDLLEAAEQIFKRTPIPVIVVSSQEPAELLEHVESRCVFGYLASPTHETELKFTVAIARSRFEEAKHLREEVGTLQQALSDRKLIERAKGLLMRQANIDEADAFRRLQHLARERSKKLVDIAEMIITADQLVHAAPA